jgi:hypothetical protein
MQTRRSPAADEGESIRMADQRPPAAAVSDRNWTITGASAETRELVREAAAKEGLTIRAWVDKTLNAAATIALNRDSESAGGSSTVDTATVAELSAKMDLVLSRLGADAQDASASLQTPLAAVYERFLNRTAEVFDELGETSRRLAEAAAEAESEAARAATAPRRRAAPAGKPKPKAKAKLASPPTVQAKPKATVRAKPPRKVRGKPKKRAGT